MAEDEAAAYDFSIELQRRRRVSDATYARALKLFGEQGIIDLIGIIGYYSLHRHDDERGAHQARHRARSSRCSAFRIDAWPADANTNRIAGLEALLKAQAGKGPAPVEKWNPPYCGDIGMKIRADGVWIYRGSPIGRMPLVKLFASVLRKDADGRHYLVTPAEKVDVEVADAPFLAVEMEVRGSGREQSLDLPHQRRRHRHGRPGASAALRGRAGQRRASSPTCSCAAGSRRW